MTVQSGFCLEGWETDSCFDHAFFLFSLSFILKEFLFLATLYLVLLRFVKIVHL